MMITTPCALYATIAGLYLAAALGADKTAVALLLAEAYLLAALSE